MSHSPLPMNEGTRSTCMCGDCSGACRKKPGWLMPGQLEIIATASGLSPKEAFDKWFAVDWWDGDPRLGKSEMSNVFALSPATSEPGQMFPADPRGSCILLKEGLCSIHPVKPFECAQYVHGDTRGQVHDRHRSVAIAWIAHQEQLRQLLGREPVAEAWERPGGLFGDMLGWY